MALNYLNFIVESIKSKPAPANKRAKKAVKKKEAAPKPVVEPELDISAELADLPLEDEEVYLSEDSQEAFKGFFTLIT